MNLARLLGSSAVIILLSSSTLLAASKGKWFNHMVDPAYVSPAQLYMYRGFSIHPAYGPFSYEYQSTANGTTETTEQDGTALFGGFAYAPTAKFRIGTTYSSLATESKTGTLSADATSTNLTPQIGLDMGQVVLGVGYSMQNRTSKVDTTGAVENEGSNAAPNIGLLYYGSDFELGLYKQLESNQEIDATAEPTKIEVDIESIDAVHGRVQVDVVRLGILFRQIDKGSVDDRTIKREKKYNSYTLGLEFPYVGIYLTQNEAIYADEDYASTTTIPNQQITATLDLPIAPGHMLGVYYDVVSGKETVTDSTGDITEFTRSGSLMMVKYAAMF